MTKLAARIPGLLVCSTFAACGTAHHWQEIQSQPMKLGACYEGLVYIATNEGFQPDPRGTDRGEGTWQSRWRHRDSDMHYRVRYRLVAEILLDEGSDEKGWPVLFAVEQEKAKDLRDYADPKEDDWSRVGQDEEAEARLLSKLKSRLAPKEAKDIGAPAR